MEITIAKDSGRQSWEKYVVEHAHSIAWQSYDWYTVVKKHYPVEFFPLVARSGSEIHGVLPLYRVGTKPGRNMLISVPYAVAGGILSGHDEAEAKLLEKAIQMSSEFQSRGIALKQYKIKMKGTLRTDEGFYNKELDISRGMDSVWKNLDGVNKQNIEDAKKYELVLEHPVRDIGRFYRLLLRFHHAKGIPCVSRKWIEDLVAFKLYSAALLTLNGYPVAGTLTKEFKDTVSFPFTCIARDDERHRMYAYALYWKLITLFASQGKRIYHSGRIPANNAAEAYRLGWGGTPYDYYYQYYPAGDSMRGESRKKGRKRELFESVWKRLPMSVAGWLGPSIVKRFP